MSAEVLGQAAVYGVFLGGLYGLAAVGFTLIFGVMKVLNISHGSLLMLGAYGSFWLFTLWNVDPYVSIPITGLALFLIGLVMYKTTIAGLIELPEKSKINTSLLVTFGLILILDNAAVLAFTGNERSITPAYSGLGAHFLGISFPYTRIAGLLLSIAIIISLHQFLQKTYFGKSVRAITQNWKAASMMGIDVSRTCLIAFGLSAALAGIAGTLVGISSAIFPAMGMEWTLKALIIVALGGMGSIGGSLAAGLLLGVVESISAIFIGPYMSAVGLIMFLIVVSVRPQGLFGSGEKAI